MDCGRYTILSLANRRLQILIRMLLSISDSATFGIQSALTCEKMNRDPKMMRLLIRRTALSDLTCTDFACQDPTTAKHGDTGNQNSDPCLLSPIPSVNQN